MDTLKAVPFCLIGLCLPLALRAFGTLAMATFGHFDNDEAIAVITEHLSILQLTTLMAMFYLVSLFGSGAPQIDVGILEASLGVICGTIFSGVSFFMLRRLQRRCMKASGENAPSLLPAALRSPSPLLAFFVHTVIAPITEDLFYFGLLQSELLQPSMGKLGNSIICLASFASLGVLDGIWNVCLVRMPLGMVLLFLLSFGGGFGTLFLAHVAANISEFALFMGTTSPAKAD